MNKAQVVFAERKALELFDKWNECTGVFDPPCLGYYNEITSCITDAVHIGIQMALFGKVNLKNDNVIIDDEKFNFPKEIIFTDFHAPIYGDTLVNNPKFKAGIKENEIIGHWCEDGSPYIITCPLQIRDNFISLLNALVKKSIELEKNT